MNKLLSLIAVGVMLLGSSTYAQDATRRALAEELLVAMNMQEALDKTWANSIARVSKTQNEMATRMGRTNLPSTVSALARMNKLAELMSWENVKEDYISIYASTFTEEELEGLIEFHNSPIGKAFNAKQPELTEQITQLTRNAALKFMQKTAANSSIKANTNSNLNRCINNMRIIDSAKEQAAMSYRHKDGDAVPETEMSEYVKGGNVALLNCEDGGKYTLHAIGEEPECSIHGTLSAAMEKMKVSTVTDESAEER